MQLFWVWTFVGGLLAELVMVVVTVQKLVARMMLQGR